MGSRQQRALWPIAAQISVKSSGLVGVVGAMNGQAGVSVDLRGFPLFQLHQERGRRLTRGTVEVSDAENVRRTADGAVGRAGAESRLAIHQRALTGDGGRNGCGCASEGEDDGGEVHVAFVEGIFLLLWGCVN